MIAAFIQQPCQNRNAPRRRPRCVRACAGPYNRQNSRIPRGEPNEQDHAQEGPDDPGSDDRPDRRLGKVYDAPEGFADVRVPFREIALTKESGEPPFRVYDPLRSLHRRQRQDRRREGPAAPSRGLGPRARRRRAVRRPRDQAGGQRQRARASTSRATSPTRRSRSAALGGAAGDAVRVRQGRHHHQGDDLRRAPREPRPQGRRWPAPRRR